MVIIIVLCLHAGLRLSEKYGHLDIPAINFGLVRIAIARYLLHELALKYGHLAIPYRSIIYRSILATPNR